MFRDKTHRLLQWGNYRACVYHKQQLHIQLFCHHRENGRTDNSEESILEITSCLQENQLYAIEYSQFISDENITQFRNCELYEFFKIKFPYCGENGRLAVSFIKRIQVCYTGLFFLLLLSYACFGQHDKYTIRYSEHASFILFYFLFFLHTYSLTMLV